MYTAVSRACAVYLHTGVWGNFNSDLFKCGIILKEEMNIGINMQYSWYVVHSNNAQTTSELYWSTSLVHSPYALP